MLAGKRDGAFDPSLCIGICRYIMTVECTVDELLLLVY